MKTEIRLVPHGQLGGERVIELWYDGQFVGAVYGAAGPGLRVMTRRNILPTVVPADATGVAVLEVRLLEP